jgi:signal transduction histidine kinase
MRRGVAWAIAAAVAAFGLAVEIGVGDSQPLRVAAGDLLAGLALGWAAAGAILRAPRAAAGPWLLAGAVLWFTATLASSGVAPLDDVGGHVVFAYRGALVAAVLSAACWGRGPVVVIALAWVDGLVLGIGRATWASFALAALVVVAALAAPERRVGALRLAPVLCLAAALAVPAAARELGEFADVGNRVLLTADLLIGLTAVTTLLVAAEAARTERRTTDRILNLAEDGNLADALGFALGDVHVLAADEAAAPAPGRERTAVAADGQAIAVIDHPARALADPDVRAGVEAAVALADRYERRRTALSAAADEVRESQRRMVLAADEARARLQRRLEDDAIPRALEIRDQLAASPKTAMAAEALTRAIGELRTLAVGLHPPALRPLGLAAALSALAEGAPLAVTAAVEDRRYPEDVELVVYFVCAEALTNAIKHAGPSTVTITVSGAPPGVVATVADDGIGGAVLTAGSAMVVRAAAVGGRLTIESPPGGGTTVRLEVPV